MNQEKTGLFISGSIRKIIEKAPYTLKDGTVRQDYEIDLDINTQRFPFTVTCTKAYALGLQVDTNLIAPVSHKALTTKDGKAFSIFRVIES